MDSFTLSRNWFNFSFENPELINPAHSAILFFAIEHCNRLGGKEKFGFPTQMTMDALGIKKNQTYTKYLNDLVNWGFIKMVQKSTNQYSANIISLVYALPKKDKALDKAFIKHQSKQTESTGQSKDTIDKQVNKETKKQFTEPTLEEVKNYCIERLNNVNPEKWINHYSAKGWMIGKNKMTDWKAAIRTWEDSKKPTPQNSDQKILWGNTTNKLNPNPNWKEDQI